MKKKEKEQALEETFTSVEDKSTNLVGRLDGRLRKAIKVKKKTVFKIGV